MGWKGIEPGVSRGKTGTRWFGTGGVNGESDTGRGRQDRPRGRTETGFEPGRGRREMGTEERSEEGPDRRGQGRRTRHGCLHLLTVAHGGGTLEPATLLCGPSKDTHTGRPMVRRGVPRSTVPLPDPPRRPFPTLANPSRVTTPGLSDLLSRFAQLNLCLRSESSSAHRTTVISLWTLRLRFTTLCLSDSVLSTSSSYSSLPLQSLAHSPRLNTSFPLFLRKSTPDVSVLVGPSNHP